MLLKTSVANDLKKTFLTKLDAYYNNGKVREGLHISSLIFCLRQNFFRKVNPQPHSLKTLQFFVDGNSRHSALQSLLGLRSEVRFERFGVVGTVDILDGKFPVEIKTTRAANAVPEHYFTQLSYYCVLLGVCEGFLVIQRVNCKDEKDPWEFIHVEWSVDEMEKLECELKEKSRLFRQALDSGDGSLLPCLDSSMRWKCRYCFYSKDCGGIRG